MILCLIVFSALHQADGNLGIAVPLMRYLATEAVHKGDGIPENRRPDQTSRVTFQTRFYETGRRRPIQQFFYNIYIKDSPNLTVNNLFSIPESATDVLRDGITKETGNSTGSDKDSAGRENGGECRGLADLLKELLVAIGNHENETAETISINKQIKLQGQRENLDGHTVDEVLPTPTGLLRYPNRIQTENTTFQLSPATRDKPLFQFSSDYPKLSEYPMYGSHSYREIMRKLLHLKFGKKDLDEYKMAGNMSHATVTRNQMSTGK